MPFQSLYFEFASIFLGKVEAGFHFWAVKRKPKAEINLKHITP
jgi:hypothetical protein